MPLSAVEARKLIHTRAITCQAFQREDNLWDVEAHMSDVKTYGFENHDRGQIAAGEPIHDMWLRLTMDDDFLIHQVEAITDHSPFSICPAITVNFQRLKGLTIGPGFNRRARERLGGVEGCTHLVDLLAPLATTAHQAIQPFRQRRRAEEKEQENEHQQGNNVSPKEPPRRPRHINTCHALAEFSPVVERQWPEFYRPKDNKDNQKA